MPDALAGVVLAAGAGRRFGDAPKQLAGVDGLPLLQHAIDAQAGAELHRRAVVVGSRAGEVLAAVDLRGATAIHADGWEEGMAASLRAAVAWAAGAGTGAEWLLVGLGDQPRIGAAAVRAVADAARTAPPGTPAIRATFEGAGGHPVALHRSLWPALRRLRGDVGARDLLGGAREVELGALASPHDVDTPHDLEALTP